MMVESKTTETSVSTNVMPLLDGLKTDVMYKYCSRSRSTGILENYLRHN